MTTTTSATDPALALLVIDIQQGAFDGERCPPIDDGDALVAGARALVDAAREGGVPIVFIQHSEDEPGAFEDGTRHWQLHPDVAPARDDHVMKKPASSSFERTALDEHLRGRRVDALVLCGLQSEFCVTNTARARARRRHLARRPAARERPFHLRTRVSLIDRPLGPGERAMVLEVAHLDVIPGREPAFERAFDAASRIIAASPGYLSHTLERCLERPNRYVLLVRWTTLEAHTVGFRQSAPYQEWKRLLHHFYDPFPTVEHYTAVAGAPAAAW